MYIPDNDGKPAIPYGSKVKFRMKVANRTWIDRISAWIRYAIVEPSNFDAAYDGVYWDPPPSKRYEFKFPRPPKPKAPQIYEAHLGMSGIEPHVTSYVEFAKNVLPHIKANNYNIVQLMAMVEHYYYGSFGYHITNFFFISIFLFNIVLVQYTEQKKNTSKCLGALLNAQSLDLFNKPQVSRHRHC